jgi:hypothetical protein|nr:MAG TPA: hypothetical protein [Bacteriophage sp.]
MTNEQILQAVNRLTDTYNQLNDNLALLQQTGQLPTPLYSNARIIWDGLSDYQMTDPPITDIVNVGAGAVKKYGKWNTQYIIACEDKTTITNCTNQVPVNYVVIKFKPTDKDGTFFVKQSNPDSWAHGIISAWLADPVSKAPVTFLGSACADKHFDVGKSVVLGPDNAHAWVSRYYQWIAFNYNSADLHLDDNGYAYIALSSSVATWHIGGWAVAERNTDFLWTPSHVLCLDLFGTASKATHHGLDEQLTLSRLDVNKTYKDMRIPYQRAGKDVLIGFLCLDNCGIPNPVFCGAKTQKVCRYDHIPVGNFARIRQGIFKYRWSFLHVPASEAAANTIDISGLRCLQLDIKIGENERAFYFAGAFTESEA